MQDNFCIIRSREGQETIEKVIQDPDIRFLVMDVNLQGLNGFDVTTHIRNSSGRDLVLILVGWSSISSAEMAMSVGCNEFIAKPFEPDFIAGLLNEAYRDTIDINQ